MLGEHSWASSHDLGLLDTSSMDTTTTGVAIQPAPTVCPTCGACPTCGKQYPAYPVYPVYPTYPYVHPNVPYWSITTSAAVTN
jgi:hypothetical protein